MSAIEYNNLLFEISQRFDELNVHRRLLFMCRRKLASGSEDNIQDALSLFKELEEQNNLGADRLEVVKELLKSFKEWSLFEKVEKLESKRKKYNELLELIIRALDELNDVERLISICRGKISEESEGNIQDVRSLIKELVSQNILGYDRLDILKGILNEIEKSDLVKKVEEFEERRKQEDEIERKKDESERWKAQATAVVSSVGNKLKGVMNIKTAIKVVAGGIIVVSTLEVLNRCSTFDQLVTAVNSCVLPAGTSLVHVTEGCVCLTVRAESLSALTTLWKIYEDGTLEARLYDFFVTDEVRERAGGKGVEVIVTIKEQEYEKACRELSDEAEDAGERIRRKSDSAVYFRPKGDTELLKREHETEYKFHRERIEIMEREMEPLYPEILVEACSSEGETASLIMKQHEIWQEREAGETDEKTDEPEIPRLNKAKLIVPGRLDLMQNYIQNLQFGPSIATVTTDSGYGTAASELGTEEISETNNIRLKDLSSDIINELFITLNADEAAKTEFCQFFGLKMQDQFLFRDNIERLFPDTTVRVLKECFEALQLFDLAEILEKVRPRSLRPALSSEQIEKIRGTNYRPTEYHSNVAVLIVNHVGEMGSVEKDSEKKIEAFFKGLNSRNEVVIASTGSQGTREMFLEMAQEKLQEEDLKQKEKNLRHILDINLPEKREALEMEMQRKKEGAARVRTYNPRKQFQQITQEEKRIRHELQICKENGAKLREKITSQSEKIKELEKETIKAVSTAMDKWFQNEDEFTCVAVFVIDDVWLEDIIAEKLALIPDHAKLVVSPFVWENIGNVPGTLHVVYPVFGRRTSIFTSMVEIFNKRWQILDLTSMMHELKRTFNKAEFLFGYDLAQNITIQDNLSTRLRFQKREDESSKL